MDTFKKPNREIDLYQCFEQFQNDLYNYFYNEENLNLEVIRYLAIKNFSTKFKQEDIADILDICVRTVRNGSKKTI